MPVTLPGDLLALDAREALVEVAVDPKNRERGSLRVRLREIPFGLWQGLCAEESAASLALTRHLEALKNDPTREQTRAVAEALGRLHAAQRELVRWGVVGHAAEDFLPTPIPFESAKATFDGREYTVAGERMLRLYVVLGGGGADGPGSFFPSIAGAVALFQAGKILSLEEQWAPAPEAP